MHQPLLFQRKCDKAPNLDNKERKTDKTSLVPGVIWLKYVRLMPVSPMTKPEMREKETKLGQSLFDRCYFVCSLPIFPP